MSTHTIAIDSKLASVMEGRRMSFIDVETTGVSVIHDHVISIGVAVLFPDGTLTTSAEIFGGGTSSPKALDTHKIPDSARKYKRWFEDSVESYAKLLDKSILVGHNIKMFDIPLIWGVAKRMGVSFEAAAIIDTLRLVRKIELDKAAGGGSLGNICAHLKLPYGNHDSLGDSMSCLGLLLTLVRHMENPTLDKLKSLCV